MTYGTKALVFAFISGTLKISDYKAQRQKVAVLVLGKED